jgi:hypothetical protein
MCFHNRAVLQATILAASGVASPRTGRVLSDMPGHHGHARAMTADTSCSGPLQRLRLKWVLDKGDLRCKLRHFGGAIQDGYKRDTSNYGQSEYGKLTHFYPSVLFHDDVLRDGRDIAVISCAARPTAAVYLTD